MKLKIFLIILISALFLLSKSDKSSACVDGGYEDDNTYMLFSSKTINKEDFSPFYFTFHAFFNASFDNDSINKYDNIEDWIKSLGLISYIIEQDNYYQSLKDTQRKNEYYNILLTQARSAVESVIYKSSINEINEIRKGIDGEPNKLKASSLENNYFTKFIKEKKLGEIISYISYAKKCDFTLNGIPEPKNYWERDQWFETEPIDSTQFPIVLKEGEKLINTAKLDYIKMRYAYQIIRLAHYSGDYKLCLKLCEKYVPKSQEGSLIYYWALGHKAASYRNFGALAKANYLYSQIFANCRSRRLSAYQSINIKDQATWDSTIALCKNSKEKASLFAIRGINFKNDATIEIDSIYNIDPNSEYIELLFSREVTKLEYSVMNNDFKPIWTQDLEMKKTANMRFNETNLSKLKILSNRMLHNPNVINKALWALGDAYLEFIDGDSKKAEQKMLDCENIPTIDSLQKLQLKVLRLALIVRDAKIISDSLEIRIFDEFQDVIAFNTSNESGTDMTLKFILDKLAYSYYKQGDYGKAFLCNHYWIYDLRDNPKENIINSILALIDKPNKNDFEEFLIKKVTFNDIISFEVKSNDYNNIAKRIVEAIQTTRARDDLKNQLFEIKGTMFLSQNKYREALDVFSKIKKSYLMKSENFNLKADPFCGYLESVYNFNFGKYSKEKYNKAIFAAKMLDLEEQVKIINDSKKLSDLYYLLGNAYYNVSYFGPCWEAIDFYHSSYINNLPNKNQESSSTPVRDKAYFEFYDLKDTSFIDQSKAIFCYKKALELSKNEEFKAKLNFMLAKCELNEFNIIKAQEEDFYSFENALNPEEAKLLNSNYRTYFKSLKTEYSNTKFYREAISNCTYFSNFVAKN